MDGDGRGGAALSMRAVTGKPSNSWAPARKWTRWKPLNLSALQAVFWAWGDIVALVEKAQETLEAEQSERMMRRLQKGMFNMNDLRNQLEQMQKMGGMQGLMGMMPGMAKMKGKIEEAGLDDSC